MRNDPSLNDLVRALQKRLRDRQAERLRRLEVDDEFERCRLLNRDLAHLGPSQDLVNGFSEQATGGSGGPTRRT